MYPTKVDRWIGLTLIASVIVLAACSLPFFLGAGNATLQNLGLGIVCIALAVWTAAIPFSTTYEITEAALVIRSAGFRWRVPLDAIVDVAPAHSPLSSPACSLNRLRVSYKNRRGRAKSVLISPREKEAFVQDLAEAVKVLARPA